MTALEIVTVPNDKYDIERLVRDPDDRPILRAAINAKADIIVTGDNDLLEAHIEHPVICTPSQFLEM